jgi:hypothetical protein
MTRASVVWMTVALTFFGPICRADEVIEPIVPGTLASVVAGVSKPVGQNTAAPAAAKDSDPAVLGVAAGTSESVIQTGAVVEAHSITPIAAESCCESQPCHGHSCGDCAHRLCEWLTYRALPCPCCCGKHCTPTCTPPLYTFFLWHCEAGCCHPDAPFSITPEVASDTANRSATVGTPGQAE